MNNFQTTEELQQAVSSSAELFYKYNHFGFELDNFDQLIEASTPEDWQNYSLVSFNSDYPTKGYVLYDNKLLPVLDLNQQLIKNTTLLKIHDEIKPLIDIKTGNLLVHNDNLANYNFLPLIKTDFKITNLTKNQLATSSQLEANERLKLTPSLESTATDDAAQQPQLIAVQINNWSKTEFKLVDDPRLNSFYDKHQDQMTIHRQINQQTPAEELEIFFELEPNTKPAVCSTDFSINGQTKSAPLACKQSVRLAGLLNQLFSHYPKHLQYTGLKITLLVLAIVLLLIFVLININNLFRREIRAIRRNINRGSL